MSFSALGLHDSIIQAIHAAGYAAPTPVQEQAIPAALEGADLLVSSQTGSGKTAAFMLPSLHRLAAPARASGAGPRVLVLTPTRELALQVAKAAETYGRGLHRLHTACLVGGTPYAQQLRSLRQSLDVVVATPGRLLDHMERGRIDFSRLEVLVLDEADRMLDMGFVDDIEAIVARTPAGRQTLLFSATLEGIVGGLARRVTRSPRRIEVAASAARDAVIEQRLLFADDMGHKTRLLDALLRDAALHQAVVFTATKRAAEELSDSLRGQGFSAAALHGDMHQVQRNRTLQRVRDGHTRVLVATDVAARGIDVAGISHVINFDLPTQADNYVHRIGRTGRAGRSGIAVSLAGHRERGLVRAIERHTGQNMQVAVIPGLEPRSRPQSARPEGGAGRRPGHARAGTGGPRSAEPRRGGFGGERRRDERGGRQDGGWRR